MRRTKGRCSYCGIQGVPLEREHVIPRCLYPASLSGSAVQRLTILACSACNRGWSDDEAHFRNVLLLAGEPNQAVNELWRTKAVPSFSKRDGERRLKEIFGQMKPVTVEGEKRFMIYPGNDVRVKRVIQKIIRGLSSFHKLELLIEESRVSIAVLTYPIPDYLLKTIIFNHREEGVVRYWYAPSDEEDINYIWLLTFFDRLSFIATVVAPRIEN